MAQRVRRAAAWAVAPGGGMGGMMEQMGAPKPRQLYPSLMALPDLPPERRREVEQEAHERMKAGSGPHVRRARTARPLDTLRRLRGDAGGVADAAGGAFAVRQRPRGAPALAEGRALREVALDWFKREMNLLPPSGGERAGGLFGLGWFHLAIMLVLVVFAAAMIAMYFFKMHRASTLLAKVAQAEPAGKEGGAAAAPAAAAAGAKDPAEAKQPPDSGAGAGTPAKGDCCDDEDGACATEAPVEGGEISGGLLPVVKKKLCQLRVARIVEETPGVKTFRLVACHGGGIPFSYLPGQFLTLTMPVGDKPIRRSYTISSSPTQGYYCETTVKREDHGDGSRYLHDQVKVGDTLEVRGTQRQVHLHREGSRQHRAHRRGRGDHADD